MITINKWITTAGDGYWTRKKKQVHVTSFALAYYNDGMSFGELRVYFDPLTWNTALDGLIYTDSKFLSELRKILGNMKLPAAGIDYSEQGMQGDTYVSCDVNEAFIDSLATHFPEEFIRMI